jgi:hypothetical protein
MKIRQRVSLHFGQNVTSEERPTQGHRDSLAAKLDLLPNHFFADAVASVQYLSRGLTVS